MENISYVDHYLDHLEKSGKSPGTLKQYRSDLHQFVTWVNQSHVINLTNIDHSYVITYIKHLKEKKLNKSTMKRHVSLINTFLAFFNINATIPPIETHHAPMLKSSDFISDHEMTILLTSMQRPINAAARDVLINRNMAIVYFVRYIGLRPREVSLINMDMVNMGQSIIEFKREEYKSSYKYELSNNHIQYIRDYLKTFHELKRPQPHTSDPLFVSFNNQSHDYQYDYENEQPKRLSIRGIQEMIKDEMKLAGLRKLSAKHLRSRCILDHIINNKQEKEIQQYFGLTHAFSLHRYKDYIQANQNTENP